MHADERYDRGVSSKSQAFRGETPLRPNGCCLDQHSAGRFLLSVVVNRFPLHLAHKEKTDGGPSPRKTAPHLVLIGSSTGTRLLACKSHWNDSTGDLSLASAHTIASVQDIVAAYGFTRSRH